MGISGLLPLLKEIQVQRNISEFKGQTLAVDAYVWLHRGAFGCAEDLVNGIPTTKFVDYAMFRVRLLKYHGITPIVVFDGGPLPAKKRTEVDRASRREFHLGQASALAAQGRHREARDHYTKCVDITPEMALQLIKALQAESVDYIVAPYEADAQMAFMEKEGLVDGVITEDSDMLVFGCRNVIYKLDNNGACTWISRDRFAACREYNFTGWTETEFRRMAILAGCDYLDSIPGIGIKTAHKLLRKHKTVEKVVQMVRLEGNAIVPPDYIPQFRLAELVFLHQRVYDPRQRKLVTLLPLGDGPLGPLECAHIGADMEAEHAQGIAEGRLHPETRETLQDLWPGHKPLAFSAAQDRVFGSSTKQNVSLSKTSSGPLDAWIKKGVSPAVPRPKVFLPKLVGESKSGLTRLSELKSRKSEPLPSGSTSKFFQSQSRRTLPPKSESIVVDLVFDGETDPAQLDQPMQDLSDSDVNMPEDHEEPLTSMPPSPVCSTHLSSPIKAESVREESPLSSPESLKSHDNEHRSTYCLTSPFDPAGDDFGGNNPDSVLISAFASAVGPNHPPTPSPSDDAKENDIVTLTRQPPIMPDSTDVDLGTNNVKQERRCEIDFTRFYQNEGMASSPIAVESDIETEVEETQQETAKQEEREHESIRAVAAGWKAKFTFGGMNRSGSLTPRNNMLKRKTTDDKENLAVPTPRQQDSVRSRSAPKVNREALAFHSAGSGFGRPSRSRQEPGSGKRKLDFQTMETPVMKRTRSSTDVAPQAKGRVLADKTNADLGEGDFVLAPPSQSSSPLKHSQSSPSVLSGSQKLLTFRYRG
ncbi:hypothetical protein QFC19_001327 [Naganishia cerealis]|uniref:Uncharacterized protein n=1 Tax=Naganishia cerealis TaxID=610337 RepID=A0ACC2WHB0_9TREE|nr:hypothetical protein QFC19_001327 [Naganishia cerealis]